MRKTLTLLFLLFVALIFLNYTNKPAKKTPAISPSSAAVISPATRAPTETPIGVLGTMTKSTGCTVVNGMPDHECTPGEADPKVTQANINTTICVSGYSTSVRPSTSVTEPIKKKQMAAYGDTDSMTHYELDHLISLELGGCPDCVANLWPEPYNDKLGAYEKDKVENYLHDQVCKDSIPLQTAQEEIANNWEAVYNQLPTK